MLESTKMEAKTKMSKFAKYAWFVVGYNVVVILWGVFLRASKSGDGCGQHWLTCNGEVIPTAPQFKTIIEFSHRITSSLAGIFIIVLFFWALFVWKTNKSELKTRILSTSFASLVFVVFEGILGAGLVLTGNTAETLTPMRPIWTAAHLINTLILLAFVTLTAWFASGGKRISFNAPKKTLFLLGFGIFGIFLIGISGSIAALSSMLFPSASLAESIAKDFAENSHYLLKLRISHPILSISIGFFLVWLANYFKMRSANDLWTNRFANILIIIVGLQFLSGFITLISLAPIVMQLTHLFLADAVWISFVLLAANVLGDKALE
jgi:heme A synthase